MKKGLEVTPRRAAQFRENKPVDLTERERKYAVKRGHVEPTAADLGRMAKAEAKRARKAARVRGEPFVRGPIINMAVVDNVSDPLRQAAERITRFPPPTTTVSNPRMLSSNIDDGSGIAQRYNHRTHQRER